MRLLLSTIGSRGDVQPLVALVFRAPHDLSQNLNGAKTAARRLIAAAA